MPGTYFALESSLMDFYSFASKVLVMIIQTLNQWMNWADKSICIFKVFLLYTAFLIWKLGVALINGTLP